MENENIVTLQVKLTRGRTLFLLALFFLCCHTRPLGSETLQVTTYYPAPYGGYVNLLTTGQTLLARDSGNVGIRTGTVLPPRRPLDVNGEVVALGRFTMAQDGTSTSPTWHIDNNLFGQAPGLGDRFRIFRQPNISTNGTEFFSINSSGFVGISNGAFAAMRRLHVDGDVRIGTSNSAGTGNLYGLCHTQTFGNGISTCNSGLVTAIYGNECSTGGMLLMATGPDPLKNGGFWIPHKAQNCWGTMLCCRIVPGN